MIEQRHFNDIYGKKGLLLSAFMLLVLSMPLPAQETGSGVTLEEIVVTARKKEETLQDVSDAITALSADEIRNAGIVDPMEIQYKVPGLRFMAANTPVAVIRGVGTYNNQPGVDPAVAYSVDGTYLSHHPALPPILFDLDRVEVLRGPQGTLYGRNSNGGVININTNDPVLDEFQASASATVGNWSAINTEWMANIPMGNAMAVRAALATENHNPYFDDGHQGANNYAGRLRWLIEPSEDFDFLVSFDYAKEEHQGFGSAFCPPNSAFPACATVPWEPYGGFGGAGVVDAIYKNENYAAYAEMNYRMDIGTLTSITNYRKYEITNTWVWDFFVYRPNNDNRFFTQEIRLASSEESEIEWVVGGFYSREGLDAEEDYDIFGAPFLRFNFNDNKMFSKAVFGEITAPLFTEGFSLTAGLRYTDERKSQRGNSILFDLSGNPIVLPSGGISKKDDITWKLGAEYYVTPDSLVYATVSTGFKSGGANVVPPGFGLTVQYEPEEITAYEIGSKNSFMNNRMQLNTEFFYYDYEGYQQFITEVDTTGTLPPAALFFVTASSQEATFYGGEVEFSTLLFTRDRHQGKLDLDLSWIEAEFDKFVLASGVDNSGNEVTGAPEFTIGASYEHYYDFSNGGQLRAQIETQYVAEHYTDNSNAPGSLQESYTRTGINFSYITPGGDWKLTAFVRNLEDEAVQESYVGPTSRPGDIAFMQPPRTYGLTLEWSMN